MKLHALLFCGALLAASAIGCGDNASDEHPGADSLGVDTNMVTTPLDTTTATDSMNAPVPGDTTATSGGTSTTPPVRNDTVGTDNRGASVTTPVKVDTTGSGVSAVGSGARRGPGNAEASGRRVNVVEGDTGSASGRRR